jgi:hypothetical protein
VNEGSLVSSFSASVAVFSAQLVPLFMNLLMLAKVALSPKRAQQTNSRLAQRTSSVRWFDCISSSFTDVVDATRMYLRVRGRVRDSVLMVSPCVGPKGQCPPHRTRGSLQVGQIPFVMVGLLHKEQVIVMQYTIKYQRNKHPGAGRRRGFIPSGGVLCATPRNMRAVSHRFASAP